MPKERRTREEKIRASAGFEPVTFSFVKREFARRETSEAGQPQISKGGELTNRTAILASAKKDLLKTFILGSVILAAEAVLYFIVS